MFWHVYPLGFSGAPMDGQPADPQPRLRRLLDWLDYAVELGVSGLLLGPVFASSTHGYDTVDHFAVDPRLGTDQDFDDLVAACHDKGFTVVLDGVFSHVGREHPAFRQVLADGPDADLASLFDIDWTSEGGPYPQFFEGHETLVRLNHSGTQSVDYVVEVMTHWLQRGANGWRLDAAYSVPPPFWAKVLPQVRAVNPDAWILGEVIHGDYPRIVTESGMDSLTQYELWKAIWSSLKDENFYELDHALDRHNDFLSTFTPNTFIGNHDVTRIASRLGTHAATLALSVLMTVGGIPSIYYGDERGMTGEKEERPGGDDAVRPQFPATGAEAAKIGGEQGQRVYREYQELIGLRRRNDWLVTARTEALSVQNTHYRYRVRSESGRQYLEVELDLGNGGSVRIFDAEGNVLWSHG